jgi:putative ABC transport system substrate-binding protein
MRMKTLCAVLVVALAVALLAVPHSADGQRRGKVYRVGYLTVPSRESAQEAASAFERRLNDLGWVASQNVVIDYRFADGSVERLPALAAELVRLNADVIVAGATAAVVAAKNASARTPIVMFLAIDPVGAGLVASLARPGGNVTGLTVNAGREIYGKQLEMLKTAFPRVSRVAILVNPVYPLYAESRRQIESAAHALRLQQQVTEIRDAGEFDGAFAALTANHPDAIFVPLDSLFYQHRLRLAQLAAKTGLPAMWGAREHAEAGGLMAYGANLPDLARRAASYVDKILKGAKAGDLPVEQPSTFDLVINMKTAKAMHLAISPSLLLQANQLIE